MPSDLLSSDVLTAVSAATIARTQAAIADTAAWAAVEGLAPPPRDLPVYAAYGPGGRRDGHAGYAMGGLPRSRGRVLVRAA